VSVQFEAFADTGFVIKNWKGLDQAEAYFNTHPNLAAAIHTL